MQDVEDKVTIITDKLISLLEGVGFSMIKAQDNGWNQFIDFNGMEERVAVRCINPSKKDNNEFIVGAWNPKTSSDITEIYGMRFLEGTNPDYSAFVNACVDYFELKK